MLALGAFELLGVMFGASLSHFLNGASHGPDIDVHHGVEIDGHTGEVSIADHVLGWLHFGRVPMLVLLVVFLTAFGLIGLGLQSSCDALVGHLLPALPASAATLPFALLTVRAYGGAIAR